MHQVQMVQRDLDKGSRQVRGLVQMVLLDLDAWLVAQQPLAVDRGLMLVRLGRG